MYRLRKESFPFLEAILETESFPFPSSLETKSTFRFRFQLLRFRFQEGKRNGVVQGNLHAKRKRRRVVLFNCAGA